MGCWEVLFTLRFKHKQVWHGRVVLCVSEAVETATVYPDDVGLIGLQDYRHDACSVVGQVMNLSALGDSGEGIGRDPAKGPHAVREHVFAEGYADLIQRRGNGQIPGLRDCSYD